MQKLAILIAGFMFLAGCASNDSGTARVDTMEPSVSSSSSTHTTTSGTRIYDYTPGTASSSPGSTSASTDASVSGSATGSGSGSVSGSATSPNVYNSNTYNSTS